MSEVSLFGQTLSIQDLQLPLVESLRPGAQSGVPWHNQLVEWPRVEPKALADALGELGLRPGRGDNTQSLREARLRLLGLTAQLTPDNRRRVMHAFLVVAQGRDVTRRCREFAAL